MIVLYPWQTGVNGSNIVKIKPNQSVPALIPLDRQKMYWPIVIKLID